MSNFKDFDLDLKKNNKENDVKPASITITTIYYSITYNCTKSANNPTTGMTVACCYGRAAKDNEVKPMCV